MSTTRITENINSNTPAGENAAENTFIENTNSGNGQGCGSDCPARPDLDEICAMALKRRGRRGRPRGSGRKHPENCQPKTFRNFSPLAHWLLSAIRLTGPDFMEMSHSDVVEEALVRFARSLSNRNPRLAKRLERAGR
jgi:hypothetical protein